MNTITIEVELDDLELLDTLYQTIDVEMTATKTERGEASVKIIDQTLQVTIIAQDYVAARALTNSIMRLLQTSVDVAESITIRKSED